MSNTLKIAVILGIVAFATQMFLSSNNGVKKSNFDQAQTQDTKTVAISTPPSNVVVEDGRQIITINAKGGYSPKMTTAKADMPTVIKMITKGTFDCSSSVSIPSIKYQKNLPSSGETLIDVPAQANGSTLKGTCSMGMYTFAIKFE